MLILLVLARLIAPTSSLATVAPSIFGTGTLASAINPYVAGAAILGGLFS